MSTVTGMTAEAMQAIRDGVVVDAEVVGDNLILIKYDGTTIDAGNVRGAQGVAGPAGGGLSVGTRANRPAANTVVSGAQYYASDNGITYVSDGTATWTAISWSPIRVNAIPTNPAPEDKQLIEFVASATDGVVWTFRFNAGSASAYRWEFVGGSESINEVGSASPNSGPESTTSLAYTNLTTVGPSILVPFSGDYDISVSFSGPFSTGAPGGYMSYAVGASAASDNDAAFSGNNPYHMVARTRRKTGIAANSNIVSKYRSGVSGTAVNFTARQLLVKPVRVG